MKLLILIAACLFIVTPLAFAEVIPEQPNAFATYDNTTKEVTVNWNFDTLANNTECFLKSDVLYADDLNAPRTPFDTSISFTPRYYSPITSSPFAIKAVDGGFLPYAGEVIPCSGDMKIDMKFIINHDQNNNNYPHAFIDVTFHEPNVDGNFAVSDDHLIDNLTIVYGPEITLNDRVKDLGCNNAKGNALYIDQAGVHITYSKYCDQYSEILSSNNIETSQTEFETTINNLTVSIGDAGTDLKTLFLNEIATNPQQSSFGNTTVGSYYEIIGTGTLNDIDISIQYSDDQIIDLLESSFVIYRFTDDNWIALPTIVDAENNIATAQTPGFSTFALGGSASSSSSSTSDTKKGDGGCSGDCTKPTFYKTPDEILVVKNGFVFNNNATDVINYHVPYDLIIVNTNQTYNMKLKAYESNGMMWFQLGFGVPEIGSPLNDAESIATFYLNWDDTLNRVEQVDKHTLVDITNSTVSMADCGYTSSQCYELSVDYIYRDQQKNNVVYIQACDMARNCVTHYINDGILIEGESLNTPLISSVIAAKGGPFYPLKEGLTELSRVDYKTDAWQDEYGYMWTSDNYKSFRMVDTVPVPIKEPQEMWNVMTRGNSNFDAMIQAEIVRAQLVLDYMVH